MLASEIIRKKRDGQILTAQNIKEFVKGVTDKSIGDAQIAAMTMAVFLNGMTKDETTALTLAMRDSGDVMEWKDIDGAVVDKHSSGGVGDKVSLMLAPMVAACGAYVPMISGRGLGHTGGTLDKFDSISGYQTSPSNELFRKTVKEVGCAIIGQTGNLAPADKRIYAVRDVCATVESIDLITASILSKKLAAGLDCLVMDLKCGNGAFMSSLDRAEALAKSIVRVADAAGTKTKAVITDMNQVLGYSVGNALEVAEAVDYLKGKRINPRLHKVNMELCAELLVSAKVVQSIDEAKIKLQKVLDNGEALEKFAKMVACLGGPADFCDDVWKYLPKSKIIRPVYGENSGYVVGMDTRGVGLSVIELHGGRTLPEEKIDYANGYSEFCQVGDWVDNQHPLAIVHAQNEDEFNVARNNLLKLIKIGDKKVVSDNCIIEKIGQ